MSKKEITYSLESSRAAGGSQDLSLGLFEKSHHRGSLARSSFDAPDEENINPEGRPWLGMKQNCHQFQNPYLFVSFRDRRVSRLRPKLFLGRVERKPDFIHGNEINLGHNLVRMVKEVMHVTSMMRYDRNDPISMKEFSPGNWIFASTSAFSSIYPIPIIKLQQRVNKRSLQDKANKTLYTLEARFRLPRRELTDYRQERPISPIRKLNESEKKKKGYSQETKKFGKNTLAKRVTSLLPNIPWQCIEWRSK